MSGKIDARLKELGIELPPPAKPAANYVPTVRTGNLVYVAGGGPVVEGKFEYQAAGASIWKKVRPVLAWWLPRLRSLKKLGGDLDRVVQW